MRKIAFLGLLLLLIGMVVLWIVLGGNPSNDEQNITKTSTPSAKTHTPTWVATSTERPTASLTPTFTSTPIPTSTVTLAAQVIHVTAIMPGVSFAAPITPYPAGFQVLLQPPDPTEPLPDANLLPAPYTDFENWVSFESDHPAVQYMVGEWQPLGSLQASRGQYHFTEDVNAIMRFSFAGEAIRIRYVGFTNGGVWNIFIDGMMVDAIDSYASSGLFSATRIYYTGGNSHVLELRNTENRNPASAGNMMALDAIQVYRPDNLTQILDPNIPTIAPSATKTPAPAREIELVEAPPTVRPTATQPPPLVVNASLIVAYDENANGSVDLAEGVQALSVRLVEVGSNRVLAHSFTDERGFVQLQAVTTSTVALVVPYFGETWILQPRTSGVPEAFTLLLAPGNQPSLIP